LPSVLAIRSALVPDSGWLTRHLRFPTPEGLIIHLYDNPSASYLLYIYEFGQWWPEEPRIGVGDAFYLDLTQSTLWKQHYWTWPSGGDL
jgi:hypothetical protein